MNLMTYDLHGAWEDRTGCVAPLYTTPEDERLAGAGGDCWGMSPEMSKDGGSVCREHVFSRSWSRSMMIYVENLAKRDGTLGLSQKIGKDRDFLTMNLSEFSLGQACSSLREWCGCSMILLPLMQMA